MRKLCFLLLGFFYSYHVNCQSCPPNIDFESGTFDNWTCIKGTITRAVDIDPVDIQVVNTAPIITRHTIISAQSLPQIDPFGGFPVLCPNGSKYAVKIGNLDAGGLVNGISYELEVPRDQPNYYFQYNYAVVYENPEHEQVYQPRFQIIARDISTNEIIDCSSITFSPNPTADGHQVSPTRHYGNKVLFKSWTPSTIFLRNLAGKKISLTFRVTGCAYSEHFGYAYIDINSKCNESFPGSVFCPLDKELSIIGPSGYKNYTWYNKELTQVLGNQQTLLLTPPPPSGTIIALIASYFYKEYCKDTFYMPLVDSLSVTTNAGIDKIFCESKPDRIGLAPQPGLIYSWFPQTGLSDPSISNPMLLSPGNSATIDYILTASSNGGGCVAKDTVKVIFDIPISKVLVLEGKEKFCIGSGDSAILMVQPAFKIQWYKDSIPLAGFSGERLKVVESGTYHAMITNSYGCTFETNKQIITIFPPGIGINYPVELITKNYSYPLHARPLGSTVEWIPSRFLNNANIFNPNFYGSEDITYKIIINSKDGCTVIDTQFVKVFDKIAIYVPTAFTPNNDGLNDYVKPITFGIKEIKYFRIFNRLGNLVFDLKSNAKGWNGMYKSVVQDSQVFIWMTEGLGIDGKVYNEKGTILVIK